MDDSYYFMIIFVLTKHYRYRLDSMETASEQQQQRISENPSGSGDSQGRILSENFWKLFGQCSSRRKVFVRRMTGNILGRDILAQGSCSKPLQAQFLKGRFFFEGFLGRLLSDGFMETLQAMEFLVQASYPKRFLKPSGSEIREGKVVVPRIAVKPSDNGFAGEGPHSPPGSEAPGGKFL